ncbi:hypothetical protein SSPIM334S_06303 [Streptomyces spiroverticillatus]
MAGCVFAATSLNAVARDVTTELSNGTLTSSVQNGREVSGNSSLYYSAVTYKKKKGGAINVIFLMRTANNTNSSPPYLMKSGQTKGHSFGGKAVPSTCSAVGGLAEKDQGQYWAPPLNPC